jgi:hypothetical protein
MTEQEILTILKSINYASLYVRTNGQRTKFGPGASQWQHDLHNANEQQRAAVSERLEQWTRRSA